MPNRTSASTLATDLAQASTTDGVPSPGNASDATYPGTTQVVVTPSAGVVYDIYDAHGGLIKQGVSQLDMRHLNAGTYHLRVYRPDGGTDPRNFAFSIMAPPAGQTRATFSSPDRDTIHGGDGNDYIQGNSDLDHLYGDSGSDVFTADRITTVTLSGGTQTSIAGPEVHDLEADDTFVGVPTADSLTQFSTKPLDRAITIPDRGLRLAIAQTLGIPITNGYDPSNPTFGQPLLARPILASDLASLTSLDASNRGISSLSGLENAINLTSLNLANNSVPSLLLLAPATLTDAIDAGAPHGLQHLQFLSLDNDQVTGLTPLGLMEDMRGLSADYNPIGDNGTASALKPLSGMTSLVYLSVHNSTSAAKVRRPQSAGGTGQPSGPEFVGPRHHRRHFADQSAELVVPGQSAGLVVCQLGEQ